jgi:lantibiotic modifying enzyme
MAAHRKTIPEVIRMILWEASTLDERLTELGYSRTSFVPADPITLSKRWSAAAAAGDQSALGRRLNWDNWDLREVFSALESSEVEQSSIPAWASLLESVIGRAPSLATNRSALNWFSGETEESIGRTTPFLELWAPFLEEARERLANAFSNLLERFSASARHDLERRLLDDLASRGARCAYERFDRWRRASPEGRPTEEGEPGRHLYARFVRVNLENGLVDFFQSYPALARRLATATTNWVDWVIELATRLDHDISSLQRALAVGKEPGPVVAVETHLSEAHENGRRVLALTFSCGWKVVYKPRSVDTEAAFQGFLRWMSLRGFDLTPPIVRFVAGPGYGWSEWVAQTAAGSREEVTRYFERAGALLCLVEHFGAGDLHAENVVATSEGPVLIDGET